MYSHTKKVGSVGRYGPRVSRKIRNEMVKIEDARRTHTSCPKCGKKKVKRKAAGIWNCTACNATFSGGAHIKAPRNR